MTNILAVSSNKIWRNDITGLRAVAVLPVLLFHAFPEIFPGGFYGVDVFFVISGYLISGIIFRDVLANSFSYSDFYIRRIRRIFPNLILLLVFVAVVGSFFLSAKEFEDMQKRKSGRGRDDSRPYPFTDLFDLRAYASAVYILSFDGKRLPDVKG